MGRSLKRGRRVARRRTPRRAGGRLGQAAWHGREGLRIDTGQLACSQPVARQPNSLSSMMVPVTLARPASGRSSRSTCRPAENRAELEKSGASLPAGWAQWEVDRGSHQHELASCRQRSTAQQSGAPAHPPRWRAGPCRRWRAAPAPACGWSAAPACRSRPGWASASSSRAAGGIAWRREDAWSENALGP